MSYLTLLNRVKEADHVPLVLIGNKCDLSASERQVSTQEGEDLANEWKVPFLGNIFLLNLKQHIY